MGVAPFLYSYYHSQPKDSKLTLMFSLYLALQSFTSHYSPL